jgi:hypothetical protein
MKTLLAFPVAFGRFWYDFLVGDDPKILLAVVVAVGLVCAGAAVTGLGDAVLAVGGGVLIVVLFLVSLAIDTRK